MRETDALHVPVIDSFPVSVDLEMPDWLARLGAKVRELRAANKRAILLVDGSRIFVFAAEPRGTIALE